MSHISNVMEFESLHRVHEWGIMTSSCKVSSREMIRTIIFVLVVCPTILYHVPKICTKMEITKKYTLVPGRWILPWCTSKVNLSWDPLIKFIASCILDTIYISSWSRVSSNVILTLLLAFAGIGGIHIAFKFLSTSLMFEALGFASFFVWWFTWITKTWFIKRIYLMT